MIIPYLLIGFFLGVMFMVCGFLVLWALPDTPEDEKAQDEEAPRELPGRSACNICHGLGRILGTVPQEYCAACNAGRAAWHKDIDAQKDQARGV